MMLLKLSPKSFLALLILIVVLAATFYLQLRSSIAQNHGIFVYALDDAYIHMAIAKNLALYGVWGISAQEFTGASSSPGWTVLLALAFKVAGVSIYVPLFLSASFAIVLVVMVWAYLAQWCSAPTWFVLISTLLVVLLEPVFAIVFGAMEHQAHICVVLILVLKAAERLDSGKNSVDWSIIVLTCLATALRYESLFLVGILCVLFWARGQKQLGLTLLVAAAIPVSMYSLYSLHNGWNLLPNSILAKSGGYKPVPTWGWVELRAAHAFWNIVRTAPLLALTFIYLRIRSAEYPFWHRTQILLWIAAATVVLHCMAAEVGQWLYRYEAYLWCLCVLSLLIAIGTDMNSSLPRSLPRPSRWRVAFASMWMFLLVWMSLTRIAGGLTKHRHAMNDRYLEHVQQAKFLARYYGQSSVVLNDIGAAAFYSDARILDVTGLASREPLLFGRAHGEFTKEDMAGWAEREHADVAILKDEWVVVQAVIPASWSRVGVWVLPRNEVFGDHRVAFYSIRPENMSRLRMQLQHFTSELPVEVKVQLEPPNFDERRRH